MATCRVILPNLLTGLTVAGETAATGYANASLTDDILAKAWRSSATASSFQPRVDRAIDSPAMAGWAGVFDLVPVTPGVAVTRVQLDDSPDASSWTTLGSFQVNGRGDGGMLVNSGQRFLRYTVQLSGASQIDVGLLYAGVPIDLLRSFSQRKQTKDRGTVRNDTEGGGTFTGRLRSYREVIGLNFSILTEDEHQLLMDIEDASSGDFLPIVLMPTTSRPGEIFHGRIEEVQTWERNPGAVFYERHALAFRESGRAL